jgi:S1-C subfamily serine protease
VWDNEGHILTASHVVHRLNAVEVRPGGGKTYEAKVIGQDPYSDVALLKTEPNGLKPVKAGDSENLKVGQFVLALANPYALKSSATSGIITSVNRTIRGWGGPSIENAIVTDARLNPGYSGGPLVDAWGRVIGLNVAYVSGRGIAVPINQVKNILDHLMREGTVKRGYLGIVSDSIPIPGDIASLTGVNQNEGLVVLSVEKDSPAKQAGLAFGDVLVKFNSKPVTELYELGKYLREDVVGKKVTIQVIRGEKVTELTVTPKEAEA